MVRTEAGTGVSDGGDTSSNPDSCLIGQSRRLLDGDNAIDVIGDYRTSSDCADDGLNNLQVVLNVRHDEQLDNLKP